MNNEKYLKTYRVSSARLQTWDYGENGNYFITICTKNWLNRFGEIKNGKMELNDVGNFAKKYWLEIPSHFSSAFLDEFIIMPNHIHGILILKNDHIDKNKEKTIGQKRFQNQGTNTVSSIIGSYKSIATKQVRLNSLPQFEWQSRFHDHIIRDAEGLTAIRNYIVHNPKEWEKDKFYNK